MKSHCIHANSMYMSEIALISNNNNKKNSQTSYLFPTHFLVHRKVICPPKVPPNPTSIHIYIYMYIYMCVCMYMYVYSKGKFTLI